MVRVATLACAVALGFALIGSLTVVVATGPAGLAAAAAAVASAAEAAARAGAGPGTRSENPGLRNAPVG